jgi:hypothetical protein
MCTSYNIIASGLPIRLRYIWAYVRSGQGGLQAGPIKAQGRKTRPKPDSSKKPHSPSGRRNTGQTASWNRVFGNPSSARAKSPTSHRAGGPRAMPLR